MRGDAIGEHSVRFANGTQGLVGGELVSVQASALADQLEVDADLVHLLYPLCKVGGIIIVDLELFAGKLGKQLYGFGGCMMRVPVDPVRHRINSAQLYLLVPDYCGRDRRVKRWVIGY